MEAGVERLAIPPGEKLQQELLHRSPRRCPAYAAPRPAKQGEVVSLMAQFRTENGDTLFLELP